MGMTPTVAEDGKVRQMVVVDLNTWTLLLGSVDENRVAEHLRPLVIEFQKESARALRQYWMEGFAVRASATSEQLAKAERTIKRQRKQIEQLEWAVKREELEYRSLSEELIHMIKTFRDTDGELFMEQADPDEG